MSEFECRQGHIVAPSQMIKGRYCPECGEPIVRMDGKSSRQWREIEKKWENECQAERDKREDEENFFATILDHER